MHQTPNLNNRINKRGEEQGTGVTGPRGEAHTSAHRARTGLCRPGASSEHAWRGRRRCGRGRAARGKTRKRAASCAGPIRAASTRGGADDGAGPSHHGRRPSRACRERADQVAEGAGPGGCGRKWRPGRRGRTGRRIHGAEPKQVEGAAGLSLAQDHRREATPEGRRGPSTR